MATSARLLNDVRVIISTPSTAHNILLVAVVPSVDCLLLVVAAADQWSLSAVVEGLWVYASYQWLFVAVLATVAAAHPSRLARASFWRYRRYCSRPMLSCCSSRSGRSSARRCLRSRSLPSRWRSGIIHNDAETGHHVSLPVAGDLGSEGLPEPQSWLRIAEGGQRDARHRAEATGSRPRSDPRRPAPGSPPTLRESTSPGSPSPTPRAS